VNGFFVVAEAAGRDASPPSARIVPGLVHDIVIAVTSSEKWTTGTLHHPQDGMRDIRLLESLDFFVRKVDVATLRLPLRHVEQPSPRQWEQ
jgi:hypothetical protein